MQSVSRPLPLASVGSQHADLSHQPSVGSQHAESVLRTYSSRDCWALTSWGWMSLRTVALVVKTALASATHTQRSDLRPSTQIYRTDSMAAFLPSMQQGSNLRLYVGPRGMLWVHLCSAPHKRLHARPLADDGTDYRGERNFARRTQHDADPFSGEMLDAARQQFVANQSSTGGPSSAKKGWGDGEGKQATLSNNAVSYSSV